MSQATYNLQKTVKKKKDFGYEYIVTHSFALRDILKLLPIQLPIEDSKKLFISEN